MFAAAAIVNDKRRGIAGELWDRIRKRRAEVTKHRVGSCSFYLIKSTPTRRGIHWEEISRLAGRHRTRLVIDPSIPIPSDAFIKRFEPGEFALLLMANTANRAVADSRIELYQRTVGLFDPPGRGQKLVLEMVKYFTTVKVYTQAPERYQVFCRQMLEYYGVAVMVSDDPASLKDCVITLSLGASPKGCLPRDCPVLVLGEGSNSGGIVISHLACDTEQAVLRQLPPGMNPTYFLAALYELGRQRELGSLSAVSCRIDGRAAPAEEIARLVRQRAQRLFRI